MRLEYNTQSAWLERLGDLTCPGNIKGILEGGPVTIEVGFLFEGMRVKEYGSAAKIDIGRCEHYALLSQTLELVRYLPGTPLRYNV